LSGNQTWANNSGNGNALNINSAIVSLGSNNLTFDGTDPISTGASTIITGSGAVIKDGVNTVTLAGANFYTGTTTINDGTLAMPQGAFGPGGAITIADSSSAVLLAGGSITRTITAPGAGAGTLRASGPLTVGNAGSVFEFNGVVDTQSNTVTIVSAVPTPDSFTGAGVGYQTTGNFTVRSVILNDGGTLTSGGTIFFPDTDFAFTPGSTGFIYHNGSGIATISGNVFGGTNNGDTWIDGFGTTNFTGIAYGNFNALGETINFLGYTQAGFSPAFQSFGAGGSTAAQALILDTATQNNKRLTGNNAASMYFAAAPDNVTGYSSRLNYQRTGSTPAAYSYTGAITLNTDAGVNYAAQSGDTFYLLRTDGYLWPSSGTAGQFGSSSVGGTLPLISLGSVTNPTGVMNSDIVLGVGGFIRTWFGNATPQGSGVWKNGNGTNNWSANTGNGTDWGGVSGTVPVPGATNPGPGYGKPGDAGQIARFDNTVTNYAGGTVNQDVTGLTIGGFDLNAQSGSNGYTIGTGTPGDATAKEITLDNGSRNSDIVVNSGIHTINSPLKVTGAGLGLNAVNTTDKVTINGAITGSGTGNNSNTSLASFGAGALPAGTSYYTNQAIGITKTGVGTAVLAGTVTVIGATNVNAGALEVAGSLSGTLNVNAAGTLTGTGTSSAPVNILGGTFSPGVSGADAATAGVSQLGTFNATGGVSIAAGSTFKLDLQAPSTGLSDNGVNDKLNVTGAITLTGTSNIVLTLTGGYTPTGGDLFFIALNDGVDAIAGGGTFTVADVGGFSWTLTTTANAATGAFTGGNDIAIMAVPEPNSLAMLMGSLGMALGLQRFRRRSGKSLS